VTTFIYHSETLTGECELSLTTLKTLTQCSENFHPMRLQLSPAKVPKVRTLTRQSANSHFRWEKLLPLLKVG